MALSLIDTARIYFNNIDLQCSARLDYRPTLITRFMSRYSTEKRAAKNRLVHPTKILHFFALPLEVDEVSFGPCYTFLLFDLETTT